MVETVITSHQLLPKFKQILKDAPYVKKIVYFENMIKETETMFGIGIGIQQPKHSDRQVTNDQNWWQR
jgi:hypothetical protein